MTNSNINAVTNALNSVTTAAQEAFETIEDTRLKAARGDLHAIRKLAKLEHMQNPTVPEDPGIGKTIDFPA